MADPLPPAYSEQDPHPRPTYHNLPTRTHSQATQESSERCSSDPPFASGLAYFAMRPPDPRRQGKLLAAVLTLVPGTPANDIPLPMPVQKSRRDVSDADWSAFLNHVIPSRSAPPSVPVRARYEKTGTIAATPGESPIPIVPNREHLKRVVDEWNRGFFLPRGISLVLQTSKPSGMPNPLRKTGSQMGEALYEAVKAQELSTVSLLLSHDADPDWRPTCATPQVTYAVKKDNLELLQMLLERAPNVDASAPGDGTALYLAVKQKNIDMIRMLCLYGAKVNNAHPSGGEPALFRAVQAKDVDVVRLLLAQPGIDLEKKPPGGGSSVFKAAKDGSHEILRLLLSHGAKADCWEPGSESAMYKAAKKRDLTTTTILLEHGADVNYLNYGGTTALYEACKNHDTPMIDLLLQYNADINRKSYGNKSALTWASKNGETDLVRKLVEGREEIS